MKVYKDLAALPRFRKAVITIGSYDGVHAGHQAIIQRINNIAKEQGGESIMITFYPHPRFVVRPDDPFKLINTIDERAELLSKTGLDYLIIHPFSIAFSRLTALDFVRKILVNQLNTSKLIIGYDHHFGKNREGNLEQLTEYSHLYNFEVEEIPAQDINDVSVSSTKIRKALSAKNIKTANKYLGYNFMLNGTVVNGKQLGGKIGFPTANINVKEDYKLIPKTGVYVVKSKIKNAVVFGMMNIGFRPTLEGKHQTIEVHFFDFENDLYNQNLTIEILYFLRDEEKFESVEKLISQLNKDKKIALNYIQNNL